MPNIQPIERTLVVASAHQPPATTEREDRAVNAAKASDERRFLDPSARELFRFVETSFMSLMGFWYAIDFTSMFEGVGIGSVDWQVDYNLGGRDAIRKFQTGNDTFAGVKVVLLAEDKPRSVLYDSKRIREESLPPQSWKPLNLKFRFFLKKSVDGCVDDSDIPFFVTNDVFESVGKGSLSPVVQCERTSAKRRLCETDQHVGTQPKPTRIRVMNGRSLSSAIPRCP